MTLKHIRFEQSEIMQSFAGMAHEKGLIKTDSVESKLSKIASVKTQKVAGDFTPTDNITENLLKLCNGLREQGFERYALAIENRMMEIRAAEVQHYNVQKETGEDLIESAHPEKSPEVAKAKDDNGVVENLIDRHEAIEEVATKEPKGKEADFNFVIQSLKLALGQVTMAKLDAVSSFIKAKLSPLLTELLSAHSIMMRQFKTDDDGILKQIGKDLLFGNYTGWTKTFKRDAEYKLKDVNSAYAEFNVKGSAATLNLLKENCEDYLSFLREQANSTIMREPILCAGNIIALCEKGAEYFINPDSVPTSEKNIADGNAQKPNVNNSLETGVDVKNSLLAAYKQFKSDIAIYTEQSKSLPDAAECIKWLQSIKDYVLNQEKELDTPSDKVVVMGDYAARAARIRIKLDAFKSKKLAQVASPTVAPPTVAPPQGASVEAKPVTGISGTAKPSNEISGASGTAAGK